LSDPSFLVRPGRARIAYRKIAGTGPTIVFLPGYRSDMLGSKALALEAWAVTQGRAMLRFDYAGCGESTGDFAEQTLAGWRDDALAAIDSLTEGPLVLVGSSMGGWLMLLVARERAERIAGLVGIAAAPDFTDWGYTQEEKMAILSTGKLERLSQYSPEPELTTRAFWTSGEANRVLQTQLAIDAPVRLLHGMADAEVPWKYAPHIAQNLRSADVQVILVKDGEHRLSRDQDIAMIIATVAELSGRQ